MASEKRRAVSGVHYILAATAIGGAAGWIIQGFAAGVLSETEYLGFQTFWSTLFLIVAALSGVQQEISRAARPRTLAQPAGDRRTLVTLTGVIAGGTLLILLLTSLAWAQYLLPAETQGLAPAIAVGAAAYVPIAALSGVLYGLGRLFTVAALTVTDSLFRLLAVVTVGLLAGSSVALGWSVVLPYLAAFLILWLLLRPWLKESYELDVPLPNLSWNLARAAGGAVAIGVVTSGLPMIMSVTSRGEPAAGVAAVMFVVVLTRAPLVTVMMSLQSLLTVRFRDQPELAGGRIARLLAYLAGATLLFAALSYPLVPWLLRWLWPQYELDGLFIAAIVATSGLTGALTVTGAAALAANRHSAYLAGWASASIVMVAVMLLPLELPSRVLLATAIAPVVGGVIHARALRSS